MEKNNVKGTVQQDKAEINVKEHLPFPGDMKMDITSSIDLAELVSSLFAGVFSDYHGCNVRVNDGSDPIVSSMLTPGKIYVDLYFEDHGKAESGKLKNIELPDMSKKDEEGRPLDFGYRFSKVNGASTGRVYNVTRETYESLSKFVDVTNPRWNDRTRETTIASGPYGKEKVVVSICGLSLDRIITEIYGSETEEGIFEYRTSVSTVIPMHPREFIVIIQRLDLSAVRKLQSDLGIYTPNMVGYHQYNV